MKKVTVVKTYHELVDDYYNIYSLTNAIQNPKFEDNSDDEFKELIKAIKIINAELKQHNIQYVVVKHCVDNTIYDTMSDLISKANKIVKQKEEEKKKLNKRNFKN